MCGIIGFVGNGNLKKVVLDGLSELEYRGYDSSGIAIYHDDEIRTYRAVGKLENLRKKTKDIEPIGKGIAIGHTRWATHGKPTELNAHPHSAEFSSVVHNGIIENYAVLKKELEADGVVFSSQTDTEVIVHLFEKNYKSQKNVFDAFKKTIGILEGAFAILLITKDDPENIYFAKMGSPLVVGIGENENFFASSDAPLVGLVKEAIYLHDGEYGIVSNSSIAIYNKETLIQPQKKSLPANKIYAQKEGYRFFMEKEIYEQSVVINDTIMGRIKNEQVVLEELENVDFNNISRIKLCACGTSYHAALVASYISERIAKMPTNVEIASEFRYKSPLMRKDELFIVISQSGETADTLEALKMAKKAGMKTIAICNVDNSSIVREADATVLTRAGIEKGVASTKAFATQIMTLWLMIIYAAQRNNTLTKEEHTKEIAAIRRSYKALEVTQGLHEKTKRLSKRYLHGHGFFFIGRDIFYPLALEGALKLKEISYLHAEGYPAGEMKHGPIALADTELFTIALLSKHVLYDKTKSNIEELSARDSTILTISSKQFEITDDIILIDDYEHYMLEFFAMLVVVQLLSIEVAIRLGNDVDMPRNLAKSVTVE